MSLHETPKNPHGITVFGSSIIRVEPDIAQLSFTVSQVKDHPKQAFQKARTVAERVHEFLHDARIEEVQSSRIQLSEEIRYVSGEHQFLGYSAKINFNVLLYELDRMEEILSGVVDAGANRINSVNFQTTRLKELRAEARKRAVAAAREKAELYCEAAGVQLGRVLQIEDLNPDKLRGYEGHTMREMTADDEGAIKAFNPGSILVGGAVSIVLTN
jgi:uncharacterized protein YggE